MPGTSELRVIASRSLHVPGDDPAGFFNGKTELKALATDIWQHVHEDSGWYADTEDAVTSKGEQALWDILEDVLAPHVTENLKTHLSPSNQQWILGLLRKALQDVWAPAEKRGVAASVKTADGSEITKADLQRIRPILREWVAGGWTDGPQLMRLLEKHKDILAKFRLKKPARLWRNERVQTTQGGQDVTAPVNRGWEDQYARPTAWSLERMSAETYASGNGRRLVTAIVPPEDTYCYLPLVDQAARQFGMKTFDPYQQQEVIVRPNPSFLTQIRPPVRYSRDEEHQIRQDLLEKLRAFYAPQVEKMQKDKPGSAMSIAQNAEERIKGMVSSIPTEELPERVKSLVTQIQQLSKTGGQLPLLASGPKVLYHVTPRSKTPKILREGLVTGKPRLWKNMFGQPQGVKGQLYFCTSMDAAIQLGFRYQWDSGKPVDILEVSGNIQTEPDPHPEGGLYGWVMSSESIQPEGILKVIPLTPEVCKDFITRRDKRASSDVRILVTRAKQLTKEDSLYEALGRYGCGSFDGGCYICAEALILAAGRGEMVRLVNGTGRTDHYGAKIDGLYCDFSGYYSTGEQWAAAFAQKEGIRDPLHAEEGISPAPGSEDDPPRDSEVSRAIASMLRVPSVQASKTAGFSNRAWISSTGEVHRIDGTYEGDLDDQAYDDSKFDHHDLMAQRMGLIHSRNAINHGWARVGTYTQWDHYGSYIESDKLTDAQLHAFQKMLMLEPPPEGRVPGSHTSVAVEGELDGRIPYEEFLTLNTVNDVRRALLGTKKAKLFQRKQADQVLYHGRSNDRPYRGNYIFLTPSKNYALGYSRGPEGLMAFKLKIGPDQIFTMKHPEKLKAAVSPEVWKFLMDSTGAGDELDWASISSLGDDEHEDVEDFMMALGYRGMMLKERQGINSIFLFDQRDAEQIPMPKTAGIYDGYCPICGVAGCGGHCMDGHGGKRAKLFTRKPEARIAKTLFHGTSVERAKGIAQHGLQPQVGDLVQTSYGDDAEDYDLEPLAFAGDKEALQGGVYSAMLHAISSEGHDTTDAEQAIRNWGALVIIKEGDEAMEHRHPDDGVNNPTEHPMQVEPEDYYSRDNVAIDYILTGPTLVRYLKRHGVNMERWTKPFSEQKRNALVGMVRRAHPDVPVEKIVEKVNALTFDQFRRSWDYYTKLEGSKVASEHFTAPTYEQMQWVGCSQRLYERAKARLEALRFPLTLYRAVKIPSEAELWHDHVGIYWTDKLPNARFYTPAGKNAPGAKFVLRTQVGPEMIDWDRTMSANCEPYGNTGIREQEIKLNQGAKVTINGILGPDDTEFQPRALAVIASNNEDAQGQCHCTVCGQGITEGMVCKDCSKTCKECGQPTDGCKCASFVHAKDALCHDCWRKSKTAAAVPIPDVAPLADRIWSKLGEVFSRIPEAERAQPVAKFVEGTHTPGEFSTNIFPVVTDKVEIREGAVSGWSGEVPIYVVVSDEGWHSQRIFDGGMLSTTDEGGPEALILAIQGSMSVNRLLDILESRTTTTVGMAEFSWLQSVLKHEVTHVTQHKRPPTSPKAGPDAYYNSPSEFEAYLQQILHEVDDSAIMSEPAFVKMWFAGKDNTELLRNILESNSKSWRESKKHFNEEHLREVYKEVTKLFNDRGVFDKSASTKPKLFRRTSAQGHIMGFNVNDSEMPWTAMILDGRKTIETRDSDSLRPHVGERLGIVSTGGRGPAMLVGYCVLGEPKVYRTNEEFRSDNMKHCIPQGPQWDLQPGATKFGYPISQVEPCAPHRVESQGRVFRRIARFFTVDELRARAQAEEARTGKSSDQLLEDLYASQDGDAFPGFAKEAAKSRDSNYGYQQETKEIRERSKTPEAHRPHKFSPAKWTFPNGHPRCRICGDEEPMGGKCRGRKSATLFARSSGKTSAYLTKDKIKAEGERIRRQAATMQVRPNDIGLKTLTEFLHQQNPNDIQHPSDSYDWDLARMNRDSSQRDIGDWQGDPFRCIKHEGGYTFMAGDELVGVYDGSTLYVRRGVKIPTRFFSYTMKPVDFTFNHVVEVKYPSEYLTKVFDPAADMQRRYPKVLQTIGEYQLRAENDEPNANLALVRNGLICAVAQDEWGATLVSVAREYRGLGLGALIRKAWGERNPGYRSGGYTAAGQRMAIRVWSDRVRELLSHGVYSDMVARKLMTPQRVQDIVKDLRDRKATAPGTPQGTAKGSGKLLVYSDGIQFVLYDAEFLQTQEDDFIRGFGFLRDNPSVGTFFYTLDYEPSFKKQAVAVALQLAKDDGQPIYVGPGYGDLVPVEGLGLPVQQDGDHLSLTEDVLDLRQLAAKEKAARKAVDPYGEIEVTLLEAAHAKDWDLSAKAASKTATPAHWDTIQFDRWFAGSKIVDSHGNPLRLYHGTNTGPGEDGWFSSGRFGYVYVTPDAAYADGYGYGDGHKVYPLYARATRPLDLRRLGLDAYKVSFQQECKDAGVKIEIQDSAAIKPTFQWVRIPGFKEACEAAGYDSIWLRERDATGKADALLLFDPKQLKSAVGNRGTYDPEDPRITASFKQATQQQDEAQRFFTYLRGEGIRFRVNEAGSRTVYVQAELPGGPFKARFADHGAPEYTDPRLAEARRTDISIDPVTGKTVEDAIQTVNVLRKRSSVNYSAAFERMKQEREWTPETVATLEAKAAGMQDGATDTGRKLGPCLSQDPRIIKRGLDYVKVYRAVPQGVTEFKDMDYCTLSLEFAKGHAEHGAAVDEEPYVVLSGIFPVRWIFEAFNPGEYFFHNETGRQSKGRVIYTAQPYI